MANSTIPAADGSSPKTQSFEGPPPIIIDPDEDFFEPGVPHSPFFYDHPKNFEPMPSPKIQPFKDEKKNPIKDFKGWYYENLADRGE